MDELFKVRCSAKTPKDFLNIDLIEQALKIKVVSQLRPIVEKKRASKVPNKDFTNVYNGIDLVNVA